MNPEVESVDTSGTPLAPAIKNWQMRPPFGGWGVSIEIKGELFEFFGQPAQIVEGIRDIQQGNGVYETDRGIWAYCNDVWCRRDPNRCLLPITWNLDPGA